MFNWKSIYSYLDNGTPAPPRKVERSEEEWKEIFMGEDGKFTMYVDAVQMECAKSSTSIARFCVKDNIVEMFKKVGEN